jgi:hypothetical protein
MRGNIRSEMNDSKELKFTPEVSKKIKSYVYRLIDPLNGETFYVGKGKGNRVFTHARHPKALKEDEKGTKVKRIINIQNSGFKVIHVIHRHGMDEKTASEVEAALIEAYPGLSNAVRGKGSNETGVMNSEQIINKYSAQTANFQHKVIMINVNRSLEDQYVYEAVRYAWVIDPKKAKRAEYILAVKQGLIIGAYIATDWLRASALNFPGHPDAPGRWGFKGAEADKKIQQMYVNKRVPEKYKKPGASNPIKYSW